MNARQRRLALRASIRKVKRGDCKLYPHQVKIIENLVNTPKVFFVWPRRSGKFTLKECLEHHWQGLHTL